LRTEYRFTERTTLSLDGFLYGGRYGGDNSSDYTDLDSTRSVIGLFDQRTSQISRNLSEDLDLTFRRFTAKNTPLFSTELEYSNNDGTTGIDLSGNVIQADASTPLSIPTERDHTVGRYPYINWKADYTLQFGAATKLESGLKATRRTTTNDFNAAYLDTGSGLYEPASSRTTAFDYHEDIGAGYLLLSNKIDKVQTQAGLRLENAATYLDLNTIDEQFDRRYASVYPSAESVAPIRRSSARSNSGKIPATYSAGIPTCARNTPTPWSLATRNRGPGVRSS
jgi:Outer membrane protein beta-barrel family